MENKIIKNILIVYLMFVVIKIIIAFLVKSPTIFADEYYYMKMARSFFYENNFFIDNTFTPSYPPLYSILISISYIFNDMTLVYFFMKVINAIISSLVIIPLFLLAKEFFSEKRSLFIAILLSVMPPLFIISPYILSENLFYTLFFFSIFFIYKSFKENKIKYDILASLFIGFSILTRIIGFVLIPLVILSTLILYKKSKIKNKPLQIIIPIIMFLPWLYIVKLHLNTLDIIKITGYELTLNNILQTKYISHALFWIPLNLAYIILATGIIFFVAYILFIISKEYRKHNYSLFYLITSILLLIFILFSSMYNLAYKDLNSFLVGRPIERYFAVLLPLIVMAGLISLKNNTIQNHGKLMQKITPLLSLLFVIATPLIFYSLFPVNNPSLIYLGIAKVILSLITNNYLIIILTFLAITPLIMTKIYKFDFNKIISFYFILFSLISLLNIMFIIYNSNTRWYTLDQTKIGLFLNDYDKGKSTILFDKRDIDRDFRWDNEIEQRERSIGIIGFWLNNKIIIGDINKDKNKANYIISTEKLDLQILIQGKSSEIRNIYVYKTIYVSS